MAVITSLADNSVSTSPTSSNVNVYATGNTPMQVTLGSGEQVTIAGLNGGNPITTSPFNFSYNAFTFPSGLSPVVTTTTPTLSKSTVSLGTVTTTSIPASWSAVTFATSYNLRRSTSSDGSGSVSVYTGANLSFNDTGLTSNTTYYYFVVASAVGYNSSTSDIVSKSTGTVVGNIIKVGTGSGDLNITQANTGAVNGDTIAIKAGTYSSLNIDDIDAGATGRIFIKNDDGIVRVVNPTRIKNVRNVTYSGDNVSGIVNGIEYVGISGRGIQCEGNFNGIYFNRIKFQNISQECIAAHFSIFERPYDGTVNTRVNDIKFLNLDVSNSYGILWRGEIDSRTVVDGNPHTPYDIGFAKGVEVSGCYFYDCPNIGSAISFGNVEDYEIHHNRFENLNDNTQSHNGIAFMSGSGSFHHNYLHEYQGDAIRAWVFSRGTTPKEVNIYDNICSRSRKYSAFEFQSFANFLWSGKTTTAICNCFHNTAHLMHYEDNSGTPSGNYYGVLLDTFEMFGSPVYVWNNVNIDARYPVVKFGGAVDYLFNGDVTNAYVGTNRYYASLADAGVTDLTYMVNTGSALKTGTFRVNPTTIDDFYGVTRLGQPTIGAVQKN